MSSGRSDAGRAHVALPMYPFVDARADYGRLWAGVAERAGSLPGELTWPDDAASTWVDDRYVVTQTCGWPLVTRLGDQVRVVGAFRHALPAAAGHRYRSAILATRTGVAADFATSVVAFNGTDSLSGWISLCRWTGRGPGELRRSGVETGSHVASLEALADGLAELVSIDAVTLAHVRRARPELLADVGQVGHGVLVPSLPVIAPSSLSDDVVERIRSAFVEEIDGDPTTARRLFITGFVPLDADDYRRELGDLVRAFG